MKKLFFTLIAAISVGVSPANAGSLTAQEQDSVRILFVGNSFTYYNDMPGMFDSIAHTQHVPVAITSIVKGGESLTDHLANERLRGLLEHGGWDYVVLQEQSSDPAMPTSEVIAGTYKSARSLDSLAKVGSPDVRVIFYMTWGHKNGCSWPRADYPLIDTYDGMQLRLITSYLEMTYENNATCAPVGLAWREVLREHPEFNIYDSDDYHPSTLGSYLAANVIYATIFHKPYHSPYTAGLNPEAAEILQQTAQNTVFSNQRLINLEVTDASKL